MIKSFITALIPSSIELSERHIEILSQQLEAVYGINGYYVQEIVENVRCVEEDKQKSKESAQGKYINIKEQGFIQTFSKISTEEHIKCSTNKQLME